MAYGLFRDLSPKYMFFAEEKRSGYERKRVLLPYDESSNNLLPFFLNRGYQQRRQRAQTRNNTIRLALQQCAGLMGSPLRIPLNPAIGIYGQGLTVAGDLQYGFDSGQVFE